MTTTRHLALTAILFDSATQVRSEINSVVVDDYAERMGAGDQFPPADVFEESGRYWIGDGWHRLLAAQKTGAVTFPCAVQAGGRQAAIRHALGANARHGLKRTNADKRRAVEIALKEFGTLSDRQIAEMCAVSDKTVATTRKETCGISARDAAPATRIDSAGRRQPAHKPKPAGAKAPAEPEPEPMPAPAPRAKFTMPDQGMILARTAISQLEKIPPSDGERTQALRLVIKWCEKQL